MNLYNILHLVILFFGLGAIAGSLDGIKHELGSIYGELYDMNDKNDKELS